MEFYRDGAICTWGNQGRGGVYILRLHVAEPLAVQFGRFQNGRLIHIPTGEYLYVGSALAQKGAASLPRRLLRHASRADSQNPHPVRQAMLSLFPKIGLGPPLLLPPISKKLRWHVDYLLDEPIVALTAVFIIRARKRNTELHREHTEEHGEKEKSQKSAQSVAKSQKPSLETAVARHLLNLPEIDPLVKGLGSSDDPGGTHLLKLKAGADWWQNFPKLITIFLRGVSA